MIDATLLEEIQQRLDRMIDRAEEEGLNKPRHSNITVFEDDDYEVELVHGEPQDETVDGFQILLKHKLKYRKSRDELVYQKIKQTESPAEKIIMEETKFSLDS